ncbi:hypothetical protein ABG768_027837 [Culter alburnus]|uniref:Uncharacterized protein n=1 Tax=Culter alburnus TaxID=194366 RepID=A0AAW2AAY6_CULAL
MHRPEDLLSSMLQPLDLRRSNMLRPGDLPSSVLRPGDLLSSPLRPGDLLSSLVHPGDHLSSPLRPGDLLSSLLHPGDHLSSPLRPGDFLSSMHHPGDFLSNVLCLGHLHLYDLATSSLSTSIPPPTSSFVLNCLEAASSRRGNVTFVSCGCSCLPADGSLPYYHTLLFLYSISQNSSLSVSAGSV